jgi:hypothetical protein
MLHNPTLLAVTEILDRFLEVLNFLTEKKMTEAQILNNDNYGKICVAIDEMVQQGDAEFLDMETILKMSKLKPIQK